VPSNSHKSPALKGRPTFPSPPIALLSFTPIPVRFRGRLTTRPCSPSLEELQPTLGNLPLHLHPGPSVNDTLPDPLRSPGICSSRIWTEEGNPKLPLGQGPGVFFDFTFLGYLTTRHPLDYNLVFSNP